MQIIDAIMATCLKGSFIFYVTQLGGGGWTTRYAQSKGVNKGGVAAQKLPTT